MENLKPNQVEFLRQYVELMESMEEAFQYLDEVPNLEETDVANTVFADLVNAAQQLNDCHKQLTILIDIQHLHKFDTFVKTMAKWFEDQNKSQLIHETIIPAFQEWKQEVDNQLKPYILQ